MPARPLLPLLLVLGAAGCAASAGYPSLSPRPIEDVSLAEPHAPPPDPGTAADAATARYAPLVAKAREGDAAFVRMADELRPALLRGRTAPLGSDAWGDAQQALTRLGPYRSPAIEAAAALQGESETPEAQADAGLARAVAAARAEVEAIDAREAETMRALTPRNA